MTGRRGRRPRNEPVGDTRSNGASVVPLALCLLIGVLPAIQGWLAQHGDPWIVQDDARQFIFWMARWDMPGLFINDPIALSLIHI